MDAVTSKTAPLLDELQIRIAFILDSSGSATGILPFVLYVFSIMVVLPLSCCCFLFGDDKECGICKGLCQPATGRFVTFNCNCPLYVTRPKNRFYYQIFFLVASSMLRVAAIIVYATAKTDAKDGSVRSTAALCGLSILCPVIMILLSTFRYRIWWHYRPSCDDERSCQNLSPKHVRFLPYHLLGDNRSMVVPGNQPCVKQANCSNRELEHIMIFHSSDHKPQRRWGELAEADRERGVYVGFHRTSAEAGVSIAHSDFRISATGKQMLGHGVYFARSIIETIGKARHGTTGGAIICAEIQMGRVKEITRSEIHTVSNGNRWWADYDTVYLINNHDNRDEFCVKSPNQILRWVMIVDKDFDKNVDRFRLNQEFGNTQCGCI